MKKLITSALILAGLATTQIHAQTHSDLSGNAPSSTNKGYVFDFKGSSANNCFAGGGVANNGGVNNQTWSVTGGNLVVTVPTMSAYDDTRQVLKFYRGDCAANLVDLSASSIPLKISVTSSPANTSTTTSRQLVLIFYNNDGSQTNYNNTPNVITLSPGQNTINTTVDLTGITDKTQILQAGFFIRGSQWGDFDAAGTYTFNYFVVGDASVPTVTSLNEDEVAASNVMIFPNPATETLNIDFANVSSNATVKLVSATGSVVAEQAASSMANFNVSGLTKGMYIVQIATLERTIRKKVMVD